MLLLSDTAMKIGLILKNLDEEYQQTIYKSILNEAKKQQIKLLCIQGESFHSVEKDSRSLFPSRHFLPLDGVLLLSSIIINNEDNQLHTLQECFKSIPAVSIGRELMNTPSITVDSDAPFCQLLEHLYIGHSYRKYLYLGGPEGNWDSQNRERVFREFIDRTAQSETYVEGTVLRGEMFSESTGSNLMSQYLETHPQKDVDIIIAGSDTVALGASRFLNSQKESSWHQCPITGFDDIPMAAKHRPALTTIRQPLREMGIKALQLLIQQMKESGAPLQNRIPGHLCIRQSCGCSDNGNINSLDKEYNRHKEEQFLRSNTFFAQALMTARNYQTILEGLKDFLENLGISCFTLLLFPRPGASIPEKARFIYEKQDIQSTFYCRQNKMVPLQSFFNDRIDSQSGGDFQLYHLHSGDQQLGLMFFSADEEKLPYMTSCGLFLSNSIKQLLVLEKEQAYAQELETRVEQRTQALKEETRKRIEVEAEVLKISDLERMRFSMDLHDDICQRLAGITMISKNAAKDNPLMQTIWRMASETLKRTREYAYDSFPVELESMGLEEALQLLCENLDGRQGISCHFKKENPPLPQCSRQVQINLYRIAQEALHNALKHSGGNRVDVIWGNHSSGLCLCIEDNGKGYPVKEEKSPRESINRRRPRGLGLRSMEYRTRQMKGEFIMEPSDSGGTRVFIRLNNKEQQ